MNQIIYLDIVLVIILLHYIILLIKKIYQKKLNVNIVVKKKLLNFKSIVLY